MRATAPAACAERKKIAFSNQNLVAAQRDRENLGARPSWLCQIDNDFRGATSQWKNSERPAGNF
jgi:hypothetical protein